MRRFVTMTALALALLPVAAFAQNPPAQPPAQPAAPAAPAQPAAPKLTFKSEVGMLLVPVKPDQTAAFEEMIAKVRSTAGASSDPALKSAGTLRAFKAAEPGPGGSAYYILLYDAAQPGAEYQWFEVINRTLTDEQKRDPATIEMYKRFAATLMTGVNMSMLNLTEVK
jgi:hypothetical protein